MREEGTTYLDNVVIALRTNSGERVKYLKKAIFMISKLPKTEILKLSNLYESGSKDDEQDYLNMNILIDTGLSPLVLLGACVAIESSIGKSSESKVIDIDILIYASVRMDSFELSLPHPRMLQRNYTLKPLLDIYPTGRAPGVFFMPKLNDIGTDGISLYDETISLA